VIEITATDKDGRKITDLDQIVITLPSLASQSSRKSCIGYQEKENEPFKCDKEEPQVRS